MPRVSIGLIVAVWLGAGLVATPAAAGNAPAALGGALADTAQPPTPVQPVVVWRDCQRIARCRGCRPVYRCRSCSYQRQCPRRRGPCAWVDVCVWGPYLPVAPPGVPIY